MNADLGASKAGANERDNDLDAQNAPSQSTTRGRGLSRTGLAPERPL